MRSWSKKRNSRWPTGAELLFYPLLSLYSFWDIRTQNRRNWRLKSTFNGYVMLTKGSIALRLRQIINPTAIIYTFLESQPTQMCILGDFLLFLAEIVEIDVAKVGTKNNEICSLRPIYLLSCYVFYIYCISWHFVGTRGITYT